MKKVYKNQIKLFKKHNNYLSIKEAALLENGIESIEKEKNSLIEYYDSSINNLDVIKFVPASGAATRMFEDLILFHKGGVLNENAISFFKNISKFPFSEFIYRTLSKTGNKVKDLENKDVAKLLIEKILNNFNYTILPKGLIPFHCYGNTFKTAFEEHFVEASHYCKSRNRVKLHFTVNDTQKSLFRFFLRSFISEYEKLYNCFYDVVFSVQDPETNTIAVNLDNTPYLCENGKEFIRPGGHGALIKNLNTLDADLIFIKNIDNVTTDSRKETTYTYKKVIGGLLLRTQNKIFKLMNDLDNHTLKIDLAFDFLKDILNIKLPEDLDQLTDENKQKFIRKKLNRPIRVCGMVRNEGQTGGGPFWIEDSKTSEVSLQIVESTQIDLEKLDQKEIFESATHFNPVDIVCGTKDYKGNSFNLENFIDSEAYFIARKTHDGNLIKVLELPGLWNGAMSNWNTLFVEVPQETFTPVKTVLDLLKPEHQGE